MTVQFAATVADRGLDVAFDITAGEVLALVGPNGAGKSTIAGVAAGLVGAERAVVRVAGRTLTDTDCGIWVPTHDRRIGLLRQDPLLFPHMSVLRNVEFAAGCSGGRRGARQRALDWLGAVGAAEWADRRPGELSGGQSQRVALARALAAEPELIVLDEPFSGLDVAVAASVRAALRRVLTAGGRPVLLITHDVLDVLALADRLMVLENGRVAEAGPVADVLAAPRSRFGARIAGLNLVRGEITGPETLLDAAGQLWHGSSAEPLGSGQSAVLVFAPAAVAIFRRQPQGSPRNAVRVRIAALEAAGAAVRVRAETQSDGTPGVAADVTADAVADLRLAPGEQVWFAVKTQNVALHAAPRTATRSQ